MTGGWLLESSQSLDVMRKAWYVRATDIFRRRFQSGDTLTGEQLREELKALGLPEPNNAHSWGALMLMLSKKKVIEQTRTWTAARNVTSNGRRLMIWRVR